jgi:signal transduction histidine kinase
VTGFEKRLYVGFAILVALFTPLLVGAFFIISQLENTQGELLSKNAQDVISAERLSSLNHESTSLAQGFVLRSDRNAVTQYESVHQKFRETANSLLLVLEPDEDSNLLKEALRLEGELYNLFAKAVSMKEAGASDEQINRSFEATGPALARDLSVLVEQNVNIQKSQLNLARVRTDHVAKRLVIGLIAACAFAFLATAAIVVLLWQMIRTKAAEDRARDERLKLELDLSNARKEAVEVVAHDLKNPLSALKMSHELMRDELAGPLAVSGDVALAFQIADRSIESMQRLIDDQLDHTKIEAGQLSLDRKFVNLSDLMRDLEVRYRPLLEAKHLRFVSQIDRALFAEVDPARIDQVISNLVGNALKFTPSGGLVQLIGRRLGPTISIVVKDNGPGISPEARSHVFERYWQVKETAKKGTGLGLSIAKGIAEAHGGKLTCTSELGRGTEFEFTIEASRVHHLAHGI